MEKFSVLTSVYKNDNVSQVEESLDSLVNQTVKPDEIIMTIDGPIPEELHAFLYDYAKKHNILKLVPLEKNVGLGNALNEGLKHCSNEYVARMDSDDICVPDRFEKQIKFITENGLDICGGAINEFIESPDKPIAKREVPLTSDEIKIYIKKRTPFNHVSVMFKKSVVLSAGSYQDMHYIEDYFLWCRMLLNNAKMGNSSDVYVNVRINEEMYMRRGGYKYFKSQKQLYKYMLNNKMMNVIDYIKILFIRFCVQVLLPNKMRAKLYKKHLRKNI